MAISSFAMDRNRSRRFCNKKLISEGVQARTSRALFIKGNNDLAVYGFNNSSLRTLGCFKRGLF